MLLILKMHQRSQKIQQRCMGGYSGCNRNTNFHFRLAKNPTRNSRSISVCSSDETARSERCEEILQMQAKGLIQRLKATKITNVVLGLSGGLDSTLALIVCCKAFDFLKINRKIFTASPCRHLGHRKRPGKFLKNLQKNSLYHFRKLI